ncbi:Dwil\GK16922-PA-like protein [Anopheles sinensis]|uniref:Dwil\GK16922-PA-like protein n=1 Tax=Anopheles sinensis TaxID=74873 RepID=A0A084W0U2_ANOSI|nr:Dwil\GK16922-PA-like protein [Anopheles sinensis]
MKFAIVFAAILGVALAVPAVKNDSPKGGASTFQYAESGPNFGSNVREEVTAVTSDPEEIPTGLPTDDFFAIKSRF